MLFLDFRMAWHILYAIFELCCRRRAARRALRHSAMPYALLRPCRQRRYSLPRCSRRRYADIRFLSPLRRFALRCVDAARFLLRQRYAFAALSPRMFRYAATPPCYDYALCAFAATAPCRYLSLRAARHTPCADAALRRPVTPAMFIFRCRRCCYCCQPLIISPRGRDAADFAAAIPVRHAYVDKRYEITAPFRRVRHAYAYDLWFFFAAATRDASHVTMLLEIIYVTFTADICCCLSYAV